jgi:hypothetical protein
MRCTELSGANSHYKFFIEINHYAHHHHAQTPGSGSCAATTKAKTD